MKCMDTAKVAQSLNITAEQVTRLEQMDTAMREAWGRPPVCRACGSEAKTRCYIVEWHTELPALDKRGRPCLRKHRGFACAKCAEGGAKDGSHK